MRYLIFSVIVLFTISCNKKWKEPTDVGVNIKIVSASENTDPNLVLDDGMLSLEEFRFDGSRKQGEDVSFENQFDGTHSADLSTGSISPGLEYDIPQGTYTRIDVELKIKKFRNDPSVIIEGNYTKNSGDEVPIRFEYDKNETFRWRAKASDNTEEIALISGVKSEIDVLLDPKSWFSEISNDQWNSAQTIDYNGAETILITKKDNKEIYDAIKDLIKENHRVTVNNK